MGEGGHAAVARSERPRHTRTAIKYVIANTIALPWKVKYKKHELHQTQQATSHHLKSKRDEVYGSSLQLEH